MVSDNMDNISHHAVIHYLGLKGLTPEEVREDMVVTLVENAPSYSIVKNWDAERKKEMFYLMMHSTHFIYGYMASDTW